MKRFIPDIYINRIAFREPRCNGRGGEIGFGTWEEAHSELVRNREKEFSDADKERTRRYKQLKAAKTMKDPTQVLVEK